MSKNIRPITISLIAVCLMLCLLLLCACNEDKTDNQDIERALYLADIEYDSESLTATAVIKFSGVESKKIDGINTIWHTENSQPNVWYNLSTTQIYLNPNAIFSAVKSNIPQDNLEVDGVVYNHLKVVIEYDTIYKSIKSDGQCKKDGKTYHHRFELDAQEVEDTLTISITNPNSANWYSLLIGVAIIVGMIVLVVYLLKKGGIWQKKKKE